MASSPPHGGLLVAILLFGCISVSYGQYGTNIRCLDTECHNKVEALLERYEYASQAVGTCDVACLNGCYEVLEEALLSTSGTTCPPVGNISACFNVYSSEWISIAEDCDLFQWKSPDAEAEAEAPTSEAPQAESQAEAEGEAEGEAPSAEEESSEAEAEAPSAEEESSEAEAEAPSAEEESSEAEAEAPSAEEESSEAEAEAPIVEKTVQGEAEAEAQTAQEASEGEAETPTTEEEAEAASPAEAESEAGEGEACASSSSGEGEGEGEASASGNGCFPDLYDIQDFEAYVQGSYYAAIWNKPSNTVGVILSVFFWISLAGMGVYLGRK